MVAACLALKSSVRVLMTAGATGRLDMPCQQSRLDFLRNGPGRGRHRPKPAFFFASSSATIASHALTFAFLNATFASRALIFAFPAATFASLARTFAFLSLPFEVPAETFAFLVATFASHDATFASHDATFEGNRPVRPRICLKNHPPRIIVY
jgi:hypothetical protein